MGGSTSKTSIEVLNEIVSEVIVKNSVGCQAGASTSQTVEFDGLEFGNCETVPEFLTSQSANLQIRMNCVQDTNTQITMMTEIRQKIDSVASAQVGALGAGFSGAQQFLQQVNRLKNEFSLDNVVRCVATASQTQGLVIRNLKFCRNGGKAPVFKQNQLAVLSLTSDCTQKATNIVELCNAIDQTVKAATTSKTGFSAGEIVSVVKALVVLVLALAFLGVMVKSLTAKPKATTA